MNVLSSLYFKDFARYFLFLESSFKKRFTKPIRFTHVAMYPCASRYLKKNNSDYISVFNIYSCNDGEYCIDKDYNLALSLASFNIKAMEMYGREEKKVLVKRAIIYLNFFNQIFIDGSFDLLISSGDSRLLPQVLIFLARRYNVPILYFEQGPFGTSTFDNKGVNANSSFKSRLHDLNEMEGKALHTRIQRYRERSEKNFWRTFRRPFKERMFEWITLLYLYPPMPLRRILPKDLQEGLSFSEFIKSIVTQSNNDRIRDISSHEALPERFILLVLQVPIDAQMIEHSPHFSGFEEMVSEAFESIPSGYELIIREHPQYRGRYRPKIYEYMRENRISTANAIPLKQLLKESSLVIVNNSTVGIEALLEGKKVVTLGNSIYSHRGVTFDFGPEISLRNVIDMALRSHVDQRKVSSYLYQLLCCYLFDGHFQDENLNLDEEKFFELVDDIMEINSV